MPRSIPENALYPSFCPTAYIKWMVLDDRHAARMNMSGVKFCGT